MIKIEKTNLSDIRLYSEHLKSLTEQDRRSRFGFLINDYAIDQLMLKMAYSPDNHELWCADNNGVSIGWGHLAKNPNDSYELAVSVDEKFQRKGVADKLIAEMLEWAKFHGVTEIYMHCIEDNKVIQHLARKHGLETREREAGERTAAIELPDPTILETHAHLWKEHKEIMEDYAKIRQRLADLWFGWK